MSTLLPRRVAALVGGRDASAGQPGADGRAAGQQGHGLGRPAVVAQRGEQRVAADQVVSIAVREPSCRRRRRCCRRRSCWSAWPCHRGCTGRRRTSAELPLTVQLVSVAVPRKLSQAAAASAGGVAADGAVGQSAWSCCCCTSRRRACRCRVGGVAADGAVGQRGRAIIRARPPPPPSAGGVAADGAVGQRGRAVGCTGRRRSRASARRCELPLTVQLVSVTVPPWLEQAAAASRAAELPLTVQLVSVIVPVLSRPPPLPSVSADVQRQRAVVVQPPPSMVMSPRSTP